MSEEKVMSVEEAREDVKQFVENFNTLKESCDEEVFNSAPDTFTTKANVIATANLYNNCIGVM